MMNPNQIKVAQEVKGFLPQNEADALYSAATSLEVKGPLLEVGSYCGKSAVYIGLAAKENDEKLYSVDHHKGSEEQQPGEEYYDPDLIDKTRKATRNNTLFLLKALYTQNYFFLIIIRFDIYRIDRC